MRHAWLFVIAACLALFMLPSNTSAQALGVSWGFARTYWDGKWYDDAYAEAGTGATMLSIRKEMPIAERTRVSIHVSYLWMRHTTTTLIEPVVVNPLTDEVISGGMMWTQTHRTYYREYGVGFNVHRSLCSDGPDIYIGGGPSVRWGQAGKRDVKEDPTGEIHKAAWFGLTILAGYRTNYNRVTTFFEPQLTFSPDQADRWQETFPPVNLVLQMGLLW